MIERDLSKYSTEERKIYTDILEQSRKEFEHKIGDITIFHWMLLDRIADAYIGTLKDGATEKKLKAAQDQLVKWTDTAFKELHSSKLEQEARRAFYVEVVKVLEAEIYDVDLRKVVLLKLKEIVEGG